MKTQSTRRSLHLLAAAALISAPAVHAADLYWNTNGTGALLTDANWAPSASGPFTTAWTDGSDIFFTANSAITYVTTTDVGNLTITGPSTVTLAAAGTYTTGGAVRTFDIGTGSTLVWNGQNISTAAGTGLIKNGGGTWNVGAQGNLFPGGLTLNAGTIIVAGVNAMGGGALNINGGRIHANSGTARDYTGKFTGITISGDFALGDATNNGALTFNAATNLGAADRTITLYSAATFNGVIGGDSGIGLTKAGTGTLTFSGTAVNTFDGGLDVNGGTLALNFQNFGSGWTDIINSGNALGFGGGLLTIAGENSANNTNQSFNGVTVNAGGGSLLVNPNGAGGSNGTTVNLNSLGTLSSWAAGSSLVVGKTLSAGTGSVTLTTTTDKDATGIYGGRVVFANGTASTGYDWASSTGGPTYTLGAYGTYNTTLPTNTASSSDNYSIVAGINLDGNLDANTLKITGSATVLALGGNTLTLKSGGLLSVGTVAQTISGTAGNKLTAGSGLGGSEDLVIHQYNSATNAGLIITAVIGNNTAGSGNAVNLVKSGIGTVALQGANTYTGNTFVNAGTLVIGSPTNSSLAGSLGNGSYAGNIKIAAGAQLSVRSSSNQTLSGVISGDGNLFKGGNGTLTLSDNNTYTGTTGVGPIAASVGGGTLIVSSFNSVFTNVGLGTVHAASSSLGAPTTVANGTITIGAGLSSSGTILKYTGPGETTDRNLSFSFNDDLGHTLDASGAGLLKFVGTVTGSGTNGSPAVTLTGTGSGEIAGVIPNFTTNPLRIAKSGNGSWTLSGTNTYTGATQVNVGKLFVNGDQTSATGAVSVAANATLGGKGTLGGNTTIDNNGKLEFNLSTSFGSHDKLELAAGKTFTFAGASTLTLTSTGGASTGLYTLVTVPGAASITGAVPASVTVPLGWTYDPPQIVADGPNTSLQINITSTGGGPGPVDHFDISAIASPQTVGTAITGITLTARDASNAVATGFTGTVNFSGTGGFTGASGSFTAGVLNSVSVTPTVAGSNLTLIVTDGVSGKTGSTTITTIQSQYQAWAGGAPFDGDANGDGVNNGLAFLLGAANPNTTVTLPVPTENNGDLVLTFPCLNDANRGGAKLYVEHSDDVGISDTWLSSDFVDDTPGAAVNGVTLSVTPGSPTNSVTATIDDTQATDGKLFGRLRAENP